MKFLGDTKAETTADTKVIWLILPRGCRRPLSTASSSPASPCSHSTHSITLGFPSPGQSSVSSISYSAYSLFPSPLLRPGDLPGSADVSISARFLLSPSLDPHSWGHVGTRWMVTRWESSDITDLHGAVVAFSWSRWTDLKFRLTDKCFS